jgi:RNA polymerase sigma-70 factor (ECF subfamily)
MASPRRPIEIVNKFSRRTFPTRSSSVIHTIGPSGNPPSRMPGVSQMSLDDSFDALATRLRAGDADAATEIFQKFAHRLIGLARLHLDARLRQKVDPEDILQSVFRSFFRRQARREFDLQSWDSLWALLSVITLRKCGHQTEHYLALCRDVNREAKPAVAQGSSTSWEAIAREPTPAEAAMLAETVQLLLEGLDDREREIVSLRLQDYSAEEISAMLRRPERTVYRVLERTRKRLQRLQTEDAPGS